METVGQPLLKGILSAIALRLIDEFIDESFSLFAA